VSSTQAQDNEWQRIWFSIRQQGWTSLAIVPSHSGIDVVRVAETLAATGRLQGEHPVNVVNGTGAQLEHVQQVLDSVTTGTDRGDWVIVPVDAIDENPSAIALVHARRHWAQALPWQRRARRSVERSAAVATRRVPLTNST